MRFRFCKILVICVLAIANSGCTYTLNTGNSWLDHGFARTQKATEKPGECCLIAGAGAGVVAVLVWLGFKTPGGINVGDAGDPGISAGYGN